jgi:hypothetical protein
MTVEEFPMSTTRLSRAAGLYVRLFWVGATLAIACLALVCAGNTEPLYRFEHTRLPLSWIVGGIAMFAFLAAEFYHPADSVPNKTEDRLSQLALEWESFEALS